QDLSTPTPGAPIRTKRTGPTGVVRRVSSERPGLFGTNEHRGKHRRPLPRHYGTAPRRPPKLRAALMAAILGYTVLGIFQTAAAVTNTISTVIGAGHYAGDGGPATNAILEHPSYVALNPSGILYF